MEGFLVLNHFALCPCLYLSWRDVSESRGSPESTCRVPQLTPPSPLPWHGPFCSTSSAFISASPIPSSVFPEVTPVSPPGPIIAFIAFQLRGSRNQAALYVVQSGVLPWAEPEIGNKPQTVELSRSLAACSGQTERRWAEPHFTHLFKVIMDITCPAFLPGLLAAQMKPRLRNFPSQCLRT